MQIDVTFFTKLGYSVDEAEQLANICDVQLGKDIKFYRNLGYSLIQSRYLAFNVFDTVKSSVMQANLSVPREFGSKSEQINNISTPDEFEQSDRALNNSELEGLFDEEYSEEDEETCEGFNCSLNSMGPFDCVSIGESLDATIANIIREEKHHLIDKESVFRNTVTSPTSTFKTTVNTASFGYIKQCIASKGICSIENDTIRDEEVINYMDYDYQDFINTSVANIQNEDYMLVGIKSKNVNKPKSNIVVLLDASGSMSIKDTTLQKSIMTIVKQLDRDDKISLITYSDIDTTIFRSLSGEDIADIILSLSRINISGCTCGSEGLNRAYQIATDNFIENGNNRVIIITDGDFNFGTYNESELKQFIREKKKSNVFLSVIGVSGNFRYNEVIMEALAREGNGNYFRLVDDTDIIEVFKNKFLNNSIVTAKDVKVQIEFNPNVVESYKLIGYETRSLSHDDFKDDKVESETLGYEQTTTALYKVKYKDKDQDIQSDLKYQKVVATDDKDICTVNIRYKHIDSDVSSVESKEVKKEIPEVIDKNILIAVLATKFTEFIKDPTNIDKYKAVRFMGDNIKDDNKSKQLLELASMLNSQNK